MLLLVVQDWISFYNQAESLSEGLTQLNIPHKLVRIEDIKYNPDIYSQCKPNWVIGIGSWHSYSFFIEKPKLFGLKVLPWVVSNGGIGQYVSGYNELELILTTSQHCKNIFIRDGLDPNRIEILPIPVNPSFWKTISEREQAEFLKMLSVLSTFPLPEQLNLLKIKKEKVPILLTIGGDATSKGAQEVIKSLGKIGKKIPWIYLIKTWPQAHTFKRGLEEFALLQKYGLEDRVRYIMGDFSKEFIRNLINICDVYVAPSRGEGFGLPLVQAQSCAKPIITMRANSTQELIVEGKTGFMVNPVFINGEPRANISELSKVLEKLLTEPALRGKMGKAARVFVSKNFQPKTIALKLISYLQSLTRN